MIKIEVTGNSIPELADKLLALGTSLRYVGMSNEFGTPLPEVAEAAPEAMQAKRDAAPSKLKVVKEATPEPVMEAAAEEPATVEESTPEPAAEAPAPAATINFETEVAPVVLMFVQKRSKEEASKILSEFGVERASLLDPTLWPELVSRLIAEMS